MCVKGKRDLRYNWLTLGFPGGSDGKNMPAMQETYVQYELLTHIDTHTHTHTHTHSPKNTEHYKIQNQLHTLQFTLT